jgi:uncharacterized membrane protein
MVGICFVISCILVISLSGGDGDAETGTTEKEAHFVKFAAISSAVLTGLMFTLNSVDIHYSLKTGISPMQMNIDGAASWGLVVFPLFLNEQLNGDGYAFNDILFANMSMMIATLAIVCMSAALQNGKAGHVQAIENMKTVW